MKLLTYEQKLSKKKAADERRRLHKLLTPENWHAICGPNGMCECGTEKGICSNRLEESILQVFHAV